MSERHYWQARLTKGGPFIALVTYHGAPLVDGEELDRHHRWCALVRNETSTRAILMGDEIPIDVDGIMVKSALNLILSRYNLAYMVDNEVLKITSRMRATPGRNEWSVFEVKTW